MKPAIVAFVVSAGLLFGFLAACKWQGDKARANLDTITRDVIDAAQSPQANPQVRVKEGCVQDLQKILNGRVVLSSKISNKAVQFFGFNAEAIVEMRLSDDTNAIGVVSHQWQNLH